MSPARLFWKTMEVSEDGFHVARHGRSVEASPVHSHDFAELFWVDTGEVTHRSGETVYRIGAGDVVLVAPDDVHRFTRPTTDLVMTNLALTQAELQRLRDRYFYGGGFPWDAAPPRRYRLSESGRRRGESLGRSAVLNRLAVDRFLIEVLEVTAEDAFESAMPDWLTEAIEAWRRDPVAMGRGITGLAEIACRSRGHVSRVIHQTTRSPAVNLINGLRLEEAAARLRTTDLSIPRVAAEVGIFSLSHFYRLFKENLGTTPARYRRS